MPYLGLVLVSALFVPLTAGAQVYKWVDANGVTHYGASPSVVPTLF